MKSLIYLFCFFVSGVAFANDPYTFVTDFKLESVTLDGTTAKVTVSHKESSKKPRFELVPGQACAQSYPAQCYGTVVRLDDSGTFDGTVKTEFQVDLSPLYYKEGVVVTIFGPDSKEITVQY